MIIGVVETCGGLSILARDIYLARETLSRYDP
jgi:hypothetical protein